MSTKILSGANEPASVSPTNAIQRIADAIGQVVNAIADRRTIANLEAELMAMDDRMLSDIGVARSEIRRRLVEGMRAERQRRADR